MRLLGKKQQQQTNKRQLSYPFPPFNAVKFRSVQDPSTLPVLLLEAPRPGDGQRVTQLPLLHFRVNLLLPEVTVILGLGLLPPESEERHGKFRWREYDNEDVEGAALSVKLYLLGQ